MPKKKKPKPKKKNEAISMPGVYGGYKKGKKVSQLGTPVTRSGKIKKK